MQVRAAALVLLGAGAVLAQPVREPYDQPQQPYQPDEPQPNGQPQPPIIYVPVPPPIIAPPPPMYVQPAPQATQPKRGGFVFRVDLGATYRYALKDSLGAGTLRLVLGGEGTGHVGFGGLFDLEMGGTKGGLFYAVLDVGFMFWGVLGDYVRLGFGPTLGFMAIQRATDGDPFEDLSAVMIGLNADLTIDILKSAPPRRSALYLVGRLRYDYLDTGRTSPYSHGGVGLLGIGARL
jgi:hypothetical protein